MIVFVYKANVTDTSIFITKLWGRKLSPVPIEGPTLKQKSFQAFTQKKDRHTIEKTINDKEI